MITGLSPATFVIVAAGVTVAVPIDAFAGFPTFCGVTAVIEFVAVDAASVEDSKEVTFLEVPLRVGSCCAGFSVCSMCAVGRRTTDVTGCASSFPFSICHTTSFCCIFSYIRSMNSEVSQRMTFTTFE